MNDDLSRRLREQVDSSTPLVPPPYDEVLALRNRRRTGRRAAMAAASVALVMGSVAVGVQVTRDDGDSTPVVTPGTTSADPRPWPTYTWSREPSPLVLRLDDRDVTLQSESYCWNAPEGADGITPAKCARGLPPRTRDLVDAGSPTGIEFWFGRPGWSFEASFTQLDIDCPRQESAKAVATGDQTFRLDPAGLRGRYRVHLFGQGDAGSAGYSFVWETPTDGSLDQPSGYIGWVSGDQEGQELTSYGIEIGINDLATHPHRGHARATATAANGKSMAVELPLIQPSHTPCSALGTFYFQTDDPAAEELLTLGPAPYTYSVDLTIDGQTWTGTGVWPRDQTQDQPYTTLEFTPALPAYSGE